MPCEMRELPSRSPCTYSGKVLLETRCESTSTRATVAFLSASPSARMTGSMALGPMPLSLATDFSVSSPRGLSVDLICVISRSERRFEKKPITGEVRAYYLFFEACEYAICLPCGRLQCDRRC